MADAENTLRRASERKLDIPDFYVLRYVIAFLKDDKTGMEREAAQPREKPGADDWMSNAEGFVSGLFRSPGRGQEDVSEGSGFGSEG